MGAGATPQLACLGSAACSVHLGDVDGGKYKLPEDVAFSDLEQGRYEHHRKRIAEQGGRDCRDYLAWSAELRRVGLSKISNTSTDALDTAHNEVLRLSLESFIEEEMRFFPDD